MRNPKVTVLMSVYNGEKYLRKAINSILNQTFKDFEYLIINDGSTDNTAKILRSYKDTRIKIIHNKKNIGLTKSLNKGLEIAKGDYVARMDADDISMPKRLKKQVDFLNQHQNVGLVGTFFIKIDKNNNIFEYGKYLISKKELKDKLFLNNLFVHGSVMFRKECIKKVGHYQKYFTSSQDYDLWLRIADFFEIAFIQEFLYKLRIHPESISILKKSKQDGNAYLAVTSGQKRRQILTNNIINNKQIISIGHLALAKELLIQNKHKEALNLLIKAFIKYPFYLQPLLCISKIFAILYLPKKTLPILRKIRRHLPKVKTSICSKFTALLEKFWSRSPSSIKLQKEIPKRNFKIGMAILAWDRPQYLKKCLDSLFQTKLYDYNITFLIQDNNSKDPRIEKIINKKRNRRYKIVRYSTPKSHHTWAGTFNKAIRKLLELDDFDIIGSCDDDAIFHPEWLDKTMKICLWAKKHHKDHTLDHWN